MARAKVPDALEMRRLKYDPSATEAERDRVAAALRAAGRRPEAILLYEAHPEHPSLREDLGAALKEGNAFQVFSLRRMGVEVTDEAIRACAAAAEAHGRWYDAHRCWKHLGDEAALARVAEHLPHFQPAVPENKA